MIGVRVQGDWENLDEISAEELLKELRPHAEAAVFDAVLHMEGAVKRTLTGTRSGRTYRVPLRKNSRGALRDHIASKEGEPPAVLYGALRNSIGHSKPKWFGPYSVTAEYGPGLAQGPKAVRDAARGYARRLEYGGGDSRGGYIEARPYMEPTEQRERPKVEGILARVAGG